MHKGSSDLNTDNDRTQRLERALGAYRAALDEGRSVDDDAFCKQHHDLMPELGIQIRMLRLIRKVDADSDAGFAAQSDSQFDDGDIRRFLQENLPSYSIEDGISRGGQGLVFRAIHLHTQRVVAIKVLADGVFASKQQLNRFLREIELAARLRHPNIVAIHDSGTVQNRPYCVMEFVDGVGIDDYVLLEQPGLTERIELFVKICRAVSYAHQRGVIHRDLKPANILVDAEGEPRLLDFGLAKDAFAADATNAGLSMPGQIIGTLQYLSPEQLRGEPGEIDIRTDIYALGLVFYHVLTGAFPYPVDGSYDAVRANILERVPTSIRGLVASPDSEVEVNTIDADVEAILRKALEKDKGRRYQSADAMADDFDRYLHGDIVEARAETRFYVLRKTIRRYRIQLAVVSGFVLFATAAAILSTVLYFRAVRERDRATVSASLAQRIMNRVFTDVDDIVSRLGGGKKAQRRIYKGSDDDLAQLADVLGNIAGVERERARVAINRGKIAARAGHKDEAARHFHVAIDGLKGLDASDAQAAALRIEAMTRLGIVSSNPPEMLLSAIDLAQSRAEQETDDEIFSVLLCEAQAEMARQSELSGDNVESAAWADRALKTFDGFDSESPYYSRMMQAAASAHEMGGMARRILGDCEAAESHFESAIDLLGKLIAASPADFLTRYQRTHLYIQVSTYASKSADPKRAAHYLDLAIDDAKLLCQVDPGDYEWSRSLILAYLNRASLERLDDPMGARATLLKCEQRLDTWQSMFPKNAQFREIRALILIFQGLFEEPDKCWAQSASYLQKSLSIYRELEGAGFSYIDTQQPIAYCLIRLGKVYYRLRAYDDAMRCTAGGMEVYRRLLAKEPRSVTLRLNFIEARFDWARLIWKTGTPIDNLLVGAELEDLLAELEEMESDKSNRCHVWLIENSLHAVRVQLRKVRASQKQLASATVP